MRAMATSLSLERYAEVQAELGAGRLRDDVLAWAGLSVEEWASAQHEWLDKMASELTLGGFELTNRYTQVFLERQRALAAPAEPKPAPKRAPASLTRTVMGSILPKEPALPFSAGSQAAEAPAQPPKMPAVHRAPAAGPSPWIADVKGTFDGVVASLQPALRFDPSAPSGPAASREARVPIRALSELGGTLDATVAPPDAPVPFKPAAPATAPPGGLSLEQYASLLVELAVEPAKTDEILRRYRITAEQRGEVEDYWQGRIGADTKTWMAFDRAYAAYRAWFVTAREK
jgi:hypothetical protein